MTYVHPCKLLIIDDDPRMRDMIRDILAEQDCEILEGRNGQEAVALAREHQPDWVIMDIEMPLLDGITATRSIRADAAAPRVLILSKHDSPPFRQAALQAGASAYLLKDELSDLKKFVGCGSSDSARH